MCDKRITTQIYGKNVHIEDPIFENAKWPSRIINIDNLNLVDTGTL